MIAAGTVELWLVPLEQPYDMDRLAPDERDRAERYMFERDRRRFTVARTALRDLLGRYLQTPPEQIEFTYGERGKPSVPGAPLDFNVSHSGEMALYGFTAGEPLGVDIEWMRPMPDALGIAERFFSVPEQEALRRVPPEHRERAFFAGWTRKEAYIKALGNGLFTSLESFAMTLDDPPRLLFDREDADAAARWRVHAFDPAPGYAAAVVVALPEPRFVHRSVIPE